LSVCVCERYVLRESTDQGLRATAARQLAADEAQAALRAELREALAAAADERERARRAERPGGMWGPDGEDLFDQVRSINIIIDL
jgi:hypothetical protein